MGGWGRGGGGKVVTDQTEVCAIFNNFLVNVAKDIGVGGAAGWGGDSMILNFQIIQILKISRKTCQKTYLNFLLGLLIQIRIPKLFKI